MPLRNSFLVLIASLMAVSITLAAQSNQGRLMGVVTDGSGGALPGVTVTFKAANARTTTALTDGSGHYITGWLPPGIYTVQFDLSGFESRTVASVALAAGQTVVLDQQLPLGALSETVEVTAPAVTPTAPRKVAPPRPKAEPVDKEILASVCGPRQPPEFSLALGHVVSRHDDPDRQLIGPGDLLRIDAGQKQGLAKGQNLVVRRRYQTGDIAAPKKQATFGEQTAGLIQIMETQDDLSVALVVYVCGEIFAGDAVERYVPQPAFFAISNGTPRFDDPAHITLGEYGRTAATEGQMMVIDRGIMKEASRGQRLTIFRRASTSAPPVTIGEGVIVAVRADSATIRIDRTTDAVMVGDLVALHR